MPKCTRAHTHPHSFAFQSEWSHFRARHKMGEVRLIKRLKLTKNKKKVFLSNSHSSTFKQWHLHSDGCFFFGKLLVRGLFMNNNFFRLNFLNKKKKNILATIFRRASHPICSNNTTVLVYGLMCANIIMPVYGVILSKWINVRSEVVQFRWAAIRGTAQLLCGDKKL